jgi:hypothetical protein
MKRTTREWVGKAESDFQLAATIARGAKPFHDQLCFHCQQSAEKYLKALLEELGSSVPRTHVLKDILSRRHRPASGTEGGLQTGSRGRALTTEASCANGNWTYPLFCPARSQGHPEPPSSAGFGDGRWTPDRVARPRLNHGSIVRQR